MFYQVSFLIKYNCILQPIPFFFFFFFFDSKIKLKDTSKEQMVDEKHTYLRPSWKTDHDREKSSVTFHAKKNEQKFHQVSFFIKLTAFWQKIELKAT